MLARLVFVVVAVAVAAADSGLPRGAQSETAAELVARARVELNAAPTAKQSLIKAESWLRQAMALQPQEVFPRMELAEVLVRQGRAAEAVPFLERGCAFARGPNQVFPCSLALAAARAQSGQFALALAEYDRHLEIADPRTLPLVHAKAGELLMALHRPSEAQGRFAQALALLDHEPEGPERLRNRALVLYGLAVAQDRSDSAPDARQTMWRALACDPSLALLDAAGAPYSAVALVPAVDVHYYRGLALDVSGQGGAAMQAFKRFVAEAPNGRWRRMAEDHLLELAASGMEAPPPAPHRARLVAAATVRSDGPLPAPLIDAAWRMRPNLIEPCLDAVPDSAPTTLRVSLSLEIDNRGVLRQVAVDLGKDVGFGVSPVWRAFETCVSHRVKSGLRLARPARRAVTSARLELVLAIGGQGASP